MTTTYVITVQGSSQQFRCAAGQSVLKAMERQGLDCVPVGCRGGGCGFCKITVLSGNYECGKMSRVHATPEAQARGQVLACRVYPLSNLVIEYRASQADELRVEKKQQQQQ